MSPEPLLTDGTALDIETGDAQHEVPGGLRRRQRRRGLGEEGPALREGHGSAAISEQAEVADPDEAVGDDMEQEAAEELVDVERHDLHAILVGIVAPADLHAIRVEGDEPIVGDGARWV